MVNTWMEHINAMIISKHFLLCTREVHIDMHVYNLHAHSFIHRIIKIMLEP